MGIGLMDRKIQNSFRKARKAGVLLLALATVVAPIPTYATQTGSQNDTSTTSKLASTLSSAIGVVSMAAGALSVAKGVQEMSCCMQGCSTGAGSESNAKKASIDGAAKESAKSVKGAQRVEPGLFKRFPDSAKADCPSMPSLGRFSLLTNFLSPQKAVAGGCLDAGIAIATGGVMLLSGAMGLLSAMQASKNADAAAANASTLGALDGTNSVATATATNTTLGATTPDGSGASGSSIKIDPALLRNGTADSVMTAFENKFGIPRDQFAQSLASGKDIKDILAGAPDNPISTADTAKAMNAAQSMSASEKQSAIDGSQVGQMQKELAANTSMGSSENSYASGGSGRSSSSGKRAPASMDDLGLGDLGSEAAAGASGLDVSPTITNALAAAEDAKNQKSHFDTSLFEVVHKKYKEKTTMISGAGLNKGVAGAAGY